MRRSIICILSLVLLISCFSGCSKNQAAEPEATPVAVSEPMTLDKAVPDAPESEETPAPTPEPDTRSRYINPLTGEAMEEDYLDYRPYAVMINNIVVAQPQVGVSQADMIWELMDEGGITRMMGIFTDMDHVEKVGSIRSARLYNVSVAQAYDAILVHCGGSQEAKDAIGYYQINDVDENTGKYSSGTFYRDPTRQAHGTEHSLFAIGIEIVHSAIDLGYPGFHPENYDDFYGLYFSDTPEDQCTGDAAYVRVTYAGGKSTNFTYDEEKGMYTAEQYGSTYTDNGEETVYFKNVLILNADTSLQEDGLHLTIEMEGIGNGYFCCNGVYTPIQWLREDSDDCFHFSTMDGQPLSLGVGKTFVAVQQVGSYSGTTEFFG